MKYTIIKAIDVAGLNFLTPVVRLCYGEEPRKQLREIGRFIVIPILAFAVFIVAWGWLAPRHKTKSGEVPTPAVVWDAAWSIWLFHTREGEKEVAYGTTGPQRDLELKEAEGRLAQLGSLEAAAREQVAQAEEARVKSVEAAVAPVLKLYEEQRVLFEAAEKKRETDLVAEAAKLPAGNLDSMRGYLAQVRQAQTQTEAEQEQLKAIKAEESRLRTLPFPPLADARRQQTKVAEERQYLTKLSEQLTVGNRSAKVDQQMEKLRAEQSALMAAGGKDVYPLAVKIAQHEKQIQTMAASTYPKPWTLPMQIARSVVCVFVGFFLGSVIAIPIGVLCGLSKTFMAAMMPFIALFKPVSPIVWLPIALIIVGGFIPDPDKHWLINGLASLPLIGWMKVNPAFIASAITVALCSLWATMVNTALGVASIDKDHINVARVLRLGFYDRLVKIVIPSALPLIFAGLRISLGVGWMVLIAAELLSSSEGIGKFVWDQFNNGASDSFAKMMVVVFVVGVIGLLLDRIMIVMQRLVSFGEATM
jgi:nitrate/nitrite transport system permease protein